MKKMTSHNMERLSVVKQDKTMGLTGSEILPAVAKQHPPPTPHCPIGQQEKRTRRLIGSEKVNKLQPRPASARARSRSHTEPRDSCE